MDFYERYWSKELEETGYAASPPKWTQEQLTRLTGIIHPFCHGDVLDIGCGDGTFTAQLNMLSEVKKVVGVEVAQRAISCARQKFPEINFQVMSGEKLSFADESFNFISAVEVVEHVLDVERLFLEFNRVMKIGGKLFITTTDFNWPKKAIIAMFFWDKYFNPTNPHIRFFTKETLRNLLEKTGFKIIKYLWNGSYLGIMPKGQIVIAKKIKK